MSDLKGFNQYHNEEEEVIEDSSSFLNIIDHDKLKDLVKESTVNVPIIEEVKDTNPFNGFPGPPGEKGEQGQTGIPGMKGPQGEQGEQGTEGVQGEQGEQGVQGEVGEQGIQGEVGEQGIQGEVGEQGEQGLQGIQGENGIQGEQGVQGIQGENGIQGEQGVQGIQGKHGEDGKEGIQGKEGLQGKIGTKGNKGDRGIPGPAGLKGIDGSIGEQGPQGEQGEQGDDGIAVAQFPLRYDEKKKKISVDTKVLQKLVTPAQAQNIDWVALAGGGAVGIRDNGAQVIKSVSDLLFKGSGVTVTRKGKDVELNITDTGTFTEASSAPSNPSDGDRWHNTTKGRLYTYVDSESAWIEF